jgi:hypothetical protein
MAAISSLPSTERGAAIATVVVAFAADPVERWLWPEADLYASCFPDFVAAFGGPAFEHESAWGLADASAVALWLAPGVKSEEEKVVGVLSETVAQEKHDDLLSTLEQMAVAHPTYPHWYLPWLAVAPFRAAASARGCSNTAWRWSTPTDSRHSSRPRTRGLFRSTKARIRNHRHAAGRKLPADDLDAPCRRGVGAGDSNQRPSDLKFSPKESKEDKSRLTEPITSREFG